MSIVTINDSRNRLLSHPIYRSIASMDQLIKFMEVHVFAVWDFMSLSKRLQREMTNVSIPWIPPSHSSNARFINEIILYEETDKNYNGHPASHLDMYIEAMEEVGASDKLFRSFLAEVMEGASVRNAMLIVGVPSYIQNFVNFNIDTALDGSVEEVASCFLYGREDAIPEMFTVLIQQWGINKNDAPRMFYYLERHIDLDGDEHGPAARKILNSVIGESQQAMQKADNAAVKAIQARIALWDGLYKEISEMSRSKEKLAVC